VKISTANNITMQDSWGCSFEEHNLVGYGNM